MAFGWKTIGNSINPSAIGPQNKNPQATYKKQQVYGLAVQEGRTTMGATLRGRLGPGGGVVTTPTGKENVRDMTDAALFNVVSAESLTENQLTALDELTRRNMDAVSPLLYVGGGLAVGGLLVYLLTR